MTGPRIRSLLPAAAGGLFAAHVLAYLVISPNAAHRHALLHLTGHGYLPRAMGIGAALAAFAAAAAAGRGVSRWRGRVAAPLAWAGLAGRLAALQAAGFVLAEIAERFAVGTPLGGLVVVLPIGVAAQAVVAAMLAALLCFTERAAESIARSVSRGPVRRAAASTAAPARRAEDVRPVLELLTRCVSVRGPPAPFTA